MRIQSQNVWMRDHFEPASIEIYARKIYSVGPITNERCDVDFGEHRIIPGFIDLINHGYHGLEVPDMHSGHYSSWADQLLQEGITSVMPSLLPNTDNKLIRTIKSLSDYIDHQQADSGCQFIGIGLEGPFINPESGGVLPVQHFKECDVSFVKSLLKAGDGYLKLMTIAPEIDQTQFTSFCIRNGLMLNIGYSQATYQEVNDARQCGIVGITNFMHAHSGLSKSDTGVLGAGLMMDDMYVLVSMDRFMSNPQLVKMLFRMKKQDHIIVVSDAVPGKGLPMNEPFRYGDTACYNDKNGQAISSSTKQIVGGITPFNKTLAFLVDTCGIDMKTALDTMTINPSRMMRMDQSIGYIGVGYDADLVVIDDQYNVLSTLSNGFFHDYGI